MQVVYTSTTVTKQYNLVPSKRTETLCSREGNCGPNRKLWQSTAGFEHHLQAAYTESWFRSPAPSTCIEHVTAFVLIEKDNKIALLIDIAVPRDTRVEEKEQEI